jgi:hypothetical protein
VGYAKSHWVQGLACYAARIAKRIGGYLLSALLAQRVYAVMARNANELGVVGLATPRMGTTASSTT